jgi:hypothetical protein
VRTTHVSGAVAVLALCAGALADVATIVAGKDNTLIEMAGLPDLSNGQGDLFAGGIAQQNPQGNAYRRRALVHFGVDSIPAGSVIESVSLTMRMTKTIGGGYDFDLHRMLADWGEGSSNAGGSGQGAGAQPGDATWNYRFFGDSSSAWTTPGGDYSAAVSATQQVNGLGSYTWSGAGLVADVQSWVDGTAPNYGWLLKANLDFLTTTAKRWASSEATTASWRPTLVVTYTVPAPGVVVVVGAGVLVVTRRRRPVTG